MEQFEKWWEKELTETEKGYCMIAWRAALEEVLKQVDQSNSDGSIIDWIKKELGDT